MTPRSRRALGWLAPLVLIASGAALTASEPPLVERLQNIVFDAEQRLAPRPWSPDLPVRVVDIDDESLQRIGQWPWPRTTLAALTQRLVQNGAAAIAFDAVFAEPDRSDPKTLLDALPAVPERDALIAALQNQTSSTRFADALAQADGRVVLAMAATQDKPTSPIPDSKAGLTQLGDDPALFVPRFQTVVAPLPDLAAAAGGLGLINYAPQDDLVTRRVPLLAKVGAQLIPSLALEALRIAQGASTYVVKASNASGEAGFGTATGVVALKVGAFEVATESDGAVRVRFAGSQPERHIPAWRVLDGSVDPEAIDGRILLVGTSAASLGDRRSTPLEASVAGVDVHAELIEHIASGARLARPDYARGAETLTLLVGGLLIAWLSRQGRPLLGALGVTVAVAALLAGVCSAFRWGDLLFDPIVASTTWIAVYSAVTLSTFRTVDAERQAVRAAFARYLAPAMVARLAADPTQLRLGGEQRSLSVLFCDVRDFTARSEALSAAGVVSFLNALHTPLTEVVLRERGTIDKYIGDGLMAFWNAPLDVADHATHACRAAWAMISALPSISQNIAADVGSTPLAIGIGINTGDCFVGNMGSDQRFDYSIVGDPVNVAARLEAATKELGAPVIVSAATAQAARGFAFVPLGALAVKGRQGKVQAFALHGPADRNPEEFATFLALHRVALEEGGPHAGALVAGAHPEGQRYRKFYSRLVSEPTRPATPSGS